MVISIALGVPKRVFMGSEEAKLASSQDTKTWNRRLKKRQEKYVTPMIVRPLVDRLIAAGVLPTPKTYDVAWEDLNKSTDAEKADVGLKRVQALAAYVAGNVDTICPPEEFFTILMEMDPDQVKKIVKAAGGFEGLEELRQPGGGSGGLEDPDGAQDGAGNASSDPPAAEQDPAEQV
jgi:hypothetical protein